MPRLMSVALTERQVRARSKTVTRRLNWWTDRNSRRLVVPGDRLTLCRKVMGRRKGEPLLRICDVVVVAVDRIRLADEFRPGDAAREGFPSWSWAEFVDFFCREMRCHPTDTVTRIEWRYLDQCQEANK